MVLFPVFALFGLHFGHFHGSFDVMAHCGAKEHWGWYQPRHEQHCMYSCLLFGSLQRQKIGTEFLLQDRWQCTLLLVLGKGFIFPDSRQLTKCWRISNWLYLCVAGSKPWHKSVAKAKAMRPQSLPPSCFNFAPFHCRMLQCPVGRKACGKRGQSKLNWACCTSYQIFLLCQPGNQWCLCTPSVYPR